MTFLSIKQFDTLGPFIKDVANQGGIGVYQKMILNELILFSKSYDEGGREVKQKRTGTEPEVGWKWNARDLQTWAAYFRLSLYYESLK